MLEEKTKNEEYKMGKIQSMKSNLEYWMNSLKFSKQYKKLMKRENIYLVELNSITRKDLELLENLSNSSSKVYSKNLFWNISRLQYIDSKTSFKEIKELIDSGALLVKSTDNIFGLNELITQKFIPVGYLRLYKIDKHDKHSRGYYFDLKSLEYFIPVRDFLGNVNLRHTDISLLPSEMMQKVLDYYDIVHSNKDEFEHELNNNLDGYIENFREVKEEIISEEQEKGNEVSRKRVLINNYYNN